jgi:mannose-6-phosphate isomerase-like protein (cupin superfamily)
MEEFPEFMKKPVNRIGKESQYTEGIEGYVFNGVDGSQMAFWTCYQNRNSKEHTHEFDEYFVVVHGQYTVIIGGKEEPMRAGQECYIPKGTPHSGRAVAGTRTIHCFGGKRVEQI